MKLQYIIISTILFSCFADAMNSDRDKRIYNKDIMFDIDDVRGCQELGMRNYQIKVQNTDNTTSNYRLAPVYKADMSVLGFEFRTPRNSRHIIDLKRVKDIFNKFNIPHNIE